MQHLNLYHPSSWEEYELIDCVDFEKLERFGKYVLIGPEPQAIWRRSLPESKWKSLAHARFAREQKDKLRFTDDVKGGCSRSPGMPESWNNTYRYNDLRLELR